MSFVLSVLAQDLRRCTVALIIRCESSGLGVQRIETDLFVKVKRQIGEGGEVLDQAAVLGVRVQSGKGVRPVYFCQPLRPLFIGLTLLFLGLAFRKLYLVPQVCTPGTPCADPRTLVRQRLVFWIVSVLLLGLLAVPWLAPLFY